MQLAANVLGARDASAGGSGRPNTTNRPIAAVITASGSVAASSNGIASAMGKVVDAGATLY